MCIKNYGIKQTSNMTSDLRTRPVFCLSYCASVGLTTDHVENSEHYSMYVHMIMIRSGKQYKNNSEYL